MHHRVIVKSSGLDQTKFDQMQNYSLKTKKGQNREYGRQKVIAKEFDYEPFIPVSRPRSGVVDMHFS